MGVLRAHQLNCGLHFFYFLANPVKFLEASGKTRGWKKERNYYPASAQTRHSQTEAFGADDGSKQGLEIR